MAIVIEATDEKKVGLGSHSVTLLIEQLQSTGKRESDRAAAAIWSRYLADLLSLARHCLSSRVSRREDADDVLQEMYKSFCRRHRQGEYVLPDRQHLWNLLAQITRNKARRAAKRHGAQRRDVRREQTEAAGDASGERPPAPADLLADIRPTADEAAEMMEELQQLLAVLPGDQRHVALRSLAGCTNREIARELGVVERTIERKLRLIRHAWGDDEPNGNEPAARRKD